jgi:serine/alanine adding enzyme
MLSIRIITDNDSLLWNDFINSHSQATVYHTYSFRQTIEKTYRHKSLYIAAYDSEKGRITGILPLFFIDGLFLGKSIVSLPFCDYGGMLYEDEKSGILLYDKAKNVLSEKKYDYLELRQTFNIPFISNDVEFEEVIEQKVRMKLELPDSSEKLFSSFPAKLRSQIRKPQKEGCSASSGGIELLNDFYSVFVYNMRDLGSPVHSKQMMANMLELYGSKARIFIVYKDNKPIACSFVVGLCKTLVNPWASFNKNYRSSAPNMLLYWSMLEFAIANEYKFFDFGRSTKDEGTYRFKEQWGALSEPLHWYYHYRIKKPVNMVGSGKNKKKFIAIWQKIPLVVTRFLGPVLRKQIPL